MNKLFYSLFIVLAMMILPRFVYNGGNMAALLGVGYVILIIIGYFANLKKN